MMKRIVAFVCIAMCIFSSCKKDSTVTGAGPIDAPPGTAGLSYKNMYVQGKALKDSSGHSFIMRGNNFPVFWFPAQYKTSLAAASSLGANTARLVWQLEQQSWTPSLAVLDEALATCITNKLIPVVELHDFTGGTNATDISKAADYFVRPDVKAILNKYSHVLIINIANEWGDGTVNELSWKNAYLPAIATLRNAGYKVPIMIDAPGYGQYENAIVQYGTDLLNSDPLKNIIFSVHAYSNWNNNSTYSNRINTMLSKGLCIVFGEFGWNVPAAQQPTGFECKVDASLLMQLCQSNNIGYMGWSWTGNDAANACFDMSTSWNDTTHLTTWGRQWAYDVNGVKNTGIKASVYQ
jgi:mannan endo-1,4-beta-mannosidase